MACLGCDFVVGVRCGRGAAAQKDQGDEKCEAQEDGMVHGISSFGNNPL